jgi:hypothetical protein
MKHGRRQNAPVAVVAAGVADTAVDVAAVAADAVATVVAADVAAIAGTEAIAAIAGKQAGTLQAARHLPSGSG